MQARSDPDSVLTGDNSYYLAQLYRHQKRYGEADGLYQKALDIFRQQLGYDHARTQSVYNDLMAMIMTAIEEGKFAEYNAGPTGLDAITTPKSCQDRKVAAIRDACDRRGIRAFWLLKFLLNCLLVRLTYRFCAGYSRW